MKPVPLALLSAVAAALALPMGVRASSVWHPASSEAGVTYHPDHFGDTKTRAQVRAEVEVARSDGTLALLQRGAPLPIKNSAAPKTRQQVADEMRNESTEARRARLERLNGG